MRKLYLILVIIVTCFYFTSLSWSACQGDINCNGLTDGADLALFAADFGTTGCGTCDDVITQINEMRNALCQLYEHLQLQAPDICIIPCAPDEFTCRDGSCIPDAYACDYDNDCGDNSDELGCGSCSETEYRCGNDSCIPEGWLCDYDNDCGDGRDESGCGLCGPFQFRCDNENCIQINLVCNGANNCGDDSDETGCFFP